MRPRDLDRASAIDKALTEYSIDSRNLPGISRPEERHALVEQIIESLRRVEFARRLGESDISPRRGDPADAMFDPLRAAILRMRQGETDEAYWLVYLFIYFGRHPVGGWSYVRRIYGALGARPWWTWAEVAVNPAQFCEWMLDHQADIRDGARSGFGNHRKYESLRKVGDGVESYVRWVAPPRAHDELFAAARERHNGDPRAAFGYLYKSLLRVDRFGRVATFDSLCMVGKLGFSQIEPDTPHLGGATGPLRGARLLVGADMSPSQLDQILLDLGAKLGVGMQVIEDSLCNWQKSPNRFRPFRG